jgi:hypothetical protein
MYVNTRQFHYNKSRKTFTAEMSELGDQPFIRVYNDACDQGLLLESQNSGQVATFYLYRTHYNSDNDIEYWELKPTRESIKSLPRLKDVKMIIFND